MSVTRNTLSLLIGSIAQKAIAFGYFALVARFLGVADTGKYFFALSWTLIFSVVTDLGLTSVLIREVAKKPEGTARHLGQVMTMKLPLVVLAGISAIVGAYLTGVRGLTLGLISFGTLVLMLDAVSLTFYGVLRGHHLLKYESLGLVVGQSLTLVLGATVLLLHLPMILLMPALIAGSLWNAGASVFFVWRRLGVKPRFGFDRAFAWTLAKTALPFALAGGFVKIYTSADVILLNRFGGDVAAGLYSVPYKLTFAFQFIPMAFTAALYPAMSHAFVTDERRLGGLFAKAQAYLMLIVAPVVAGMMALAPELVRLVYGKAFAASALPLQLLIPVLVFIFLDFPVGSMLNACNHQVTQTKLMGAATLVSVIINLTLIPTYGVMAAVVASLCSHAILYVGGLLAVGRFLKWPVAVFASSAARTALAAGLMGLAVVLTKSHVPLVVALALGAVTYPVLVLAFRAFSIPEARALLGRAFKRAV
jgi:O-antigen/teichoic acid export membrane protein